MLPMGFWILSLTGSAMILIYAILFWEFQSHPKLL
ncbi:MAG: hypothetical protein DSY98_07860 [SAR324 cluster bacterium]|uniref:Lipid A biosynthesis N-terminal domain-containing protein n=1 Tax=SAR324 cluster bacterium TaxID=2024889 RepID=A0A432G3A6_9DELT|nr:MAG: hypothetical protein DSY98_07860 [SAR324 cluster bacterium]